MKFFQVKGDFEQGVKQWRRVVAAGLEQDMLDAGKETAQHLLRKIREDAHKAGPEWEAAAEKGQVQQGREDVRLVFPAEAFDLEYGNTEKGQQPVPLVRLNVGQMRRELSQKYNTALGMRLFGYHGSI